MVGINKVGYLFRPLPSYQELIEIYPQLALMASSPIIWIVEEGGHRHLYPENRLIALKLLHLARFRSYFTRQQPDSYLEILERMMGKPPFTESAFDRWWTIERIPYAVTLPTAFLGISIEQLDSLAETGNFQVDSWIERLRGLKREEES